MCARIGLCGELAVKSPIAIKIKSRPQPHSTDVSILCDLFPSSSSFPSDFGYSHHADRYHCHLIFSILIMMINIIAIKIKSRPQPHSTDVSILCDLFPSSSSFPSDFGYSHHADRYHCHLIFSILIRMINTIAINIKSRPQPQQKDKKAKKQKDKNIERQKDKKTKMQKKYKKS